MKIAGFEKLTLLDFPGHTASIVFTAGCNFRCPFCHNGSLVLQNQTGSLFTEAEILAFLEKRKGILEGVVVTGGEPLLCPDLPQFLQKIKNLGYKIKLDTNGSLPRKLSQLLHQGLVDYVAMDIKHTPEEYQKAIGLETAPLSAIMESKAILENGTVPYEFRTTLVKGIHTEASVISIAAWIQDAKAFYLQAYKPSDGVLAPEGLYAFTREEMQHFLSLVTPIVPHAKLRGIS